MGAPVVVQPLKPSNRRGRQRLRDVSAVLHGPLPADVEIVLQGRHYVLPSEIVSVMRAGTEVLLADESVVITSQESTLTSQQAADMLNVSRPHLLKLARRGDLPHTMAGSHHRFALSDVHTYATALRRERSDALREIAPADGYQNGDF